MAKGDDALRRKKNKVIRKRLRNSESSVSARVAAIIAAKNRRKAGKRRICEGMCFSLPTEDDPFNERHEKRAPKKEKVINVQKHDKRGNKRNDSDKKVQEKPDHVSDEENKLNNPNEKASSSGELESIETVGVSKFLLLCLKAIVDTWVVEGTFDKDMAGALISNSWGADFCKACSAGSSVVDVSEAFATGIQVAWLVSTAANIIAVKEKQGIVVASPFLLFLVSSEDRAVEVKSVCKPLKALGVHTVSLHPGTTLDHQIHGLKNCEPEFLVSTPERLLELVSLNAIDISRASLLVLDGVTKFNDLGLVDSLKSIRERISGDPQIITFSNSYGETLVMLLQHLVRGSVYRLSAKQSVTSLSAFVSQYVHFYTSENEKLSEVSQIISGAFGNKTMLTSQVLVVRGNIFKVDPSNLHKIDSEKSGRVLVKDINNICDSDMDRVSVVLLAEFPSSIDSYISIVTKIARHSLAGVLHSFFSTENANLAQPLINVLEQCGQQVPEFLRSFCPANPTS